MTRHAKALTQKRKAKSFNAKAQRKAKERRNITDLKLALVINFAEKLLKNGIRRIVNGL